MTSHDPEFWEKAADVCGLYLNPPENAIVWSVDEKTSIQAKARINPAKPAVPGYPERREFEYERNGTVVLFAGLNVHQGDVAGWVTDSTCSDNFVTFLWDLMDQTPEGLDLHCIVDNLAAHQTDQVAELLAYNPRVHLHFTPTHASWLNQVELFFSILERRLLRRGEFSARGMLGTTPPSASSGGPTAPARGPFLLAAPGHLSFSLVGALSPFRASRAAPGRNGGGLKPRARRSRSSSAICLLRSGGANLTTAERDTPSSAVTFSIDPPGHSSASATALRRMAARSSMRAIK